ncbi:MULTISPECIES: helix-turn-helix domain-containing protein [Leptospira]|uniref:Helix-turn-helix transcriptional regulator n=2 Tax=Leptospira interrogans TaxID=173 RepID=A0AAQ0B132_LEPIR|nr:MULTISPECIES: helix-turn-helix transcriptional regulator [Leptospira]EKR57176.1 DNA-binding helix-turn-helix protein [Leptospira interrogans str. UI 12758]KGE21855.1 DNA-binding protein [Leptospira interrogans serovar Lai]QOI36790.1 helix-turn-helix transcriptional regulator [Leptospira interrogans serovar Icterohaemorrhagiae]QOI45188.1 helix-turn-helix transcriptional regulator [Leptospira interrogans serovar Canicola]ULG86773.1 helix-turn-helix domain-containing protein [Leptospira interr
MKNIHDVITNRKNCLRSEAEEKEYLIDYIRKFVDAKRGNQKLLAEASGIRQSTISNLIRNAGPSPGMEVIIALAEEIQKI